MTIPKGWQTVVMESGFLMWICPHEREHPAPPEHQPWHMHRPVFYEHRCDGCCLDIPYPIDHVHP